VLAAPYLPNIFIALWQWDKGTVHCPEPLGVIHGRAYMFTNKDGDLKAAVVPFETPSMTGHLYHLIS
jgi:hypothetical protein